MKTPVKEYPPTPELDKLDAIKEKSQVIGEFLEEFLQSKGYTIGRPHQHGPTCRGWDAEENRYRPSGDERCSFQTGEFEAIGVNTQKLLAEFFGIDEEKMEIERRAILEWRLDIF